MSNQSIQAAPTKKRRRSVEIATSRRQRLPTVSRSSSSFAARRSAGVVDPTKQKMEEIVRLLRLWRWSFPTLLKNWLQYKSDTRDRKRKLRKLADNLDVILADEDIDTIMEQDVDQKIFNVMLPSCVKKIRRELGVLQQGVPVFGKWSAEVEFESLQIPRAADDVKKYAPVLYQLVHGLAENARQDYNREEQNGRIVLVTSVLSVGRARNTANCFSRLLGLYLQSAGLKRRGLQVLHGLGVIENYRTIDEAKKVLGVRSEACSQNVTTGDAG